MLLTVKVRKDYMNAAQHGRWLLATPPASAQFPLPPTSAVASSAEEEGLGVVEAISVGKHH